MLDHFTRIEYKQTGETLSPLESVLLSILPSNKLWAIDDIYSEYAEYCSKNKEDSQHYTRNKQDVLVAVSRLVKVGVARRVEGNRLSRFISGRA